MGKNMNNSYIGQRLPDITIDEMKRKAKTKPKYALFLAYRYENGIGVKKNLEKAYQWLEYAISKPNSNWANNRIATYLFNGWGVSQDREHALSIWQANLNLINKALWKENTNIQEDSVYAWAKDIFMNANYNLGYCYLNGIAVERNIDIALNYFKQSALIPNREALYTLAKLYSGEYGFPQNNCKAFRYRKSVCDYDFATSSDFHNVGVCYQKGIGVRKNVEKAFEYFKKAADMGNPGSIMIVSNCYIYGMGVEQDFNKAFRYARKLLKMAKPNKSKRHAESLTT